MSTPDLAHALGVSGPLAAALALAAPLVLPIAIEPFLFLRTERAPDRRPWLRAGLCAVALACLASAFAPIWLLAAALVLTAPAWGVGTGTAQLALLERAPAGTHASLLTRWTLFAGIGDLAAPAVLAAVSIAGLSWRAGFVIVAAVALAMIALVPPLPRDAARSNSADKTQDCDPGSCTQADDAPLRDAFRALVRSPRLLAWGAGVQLCTFLDEILIALGALHVTARFGGGVAPRAIVLGCLLAGSIAGLLLLEQVLARTRVSPRRCLIALGAACTVSLLAWLAAPSLAASAVMAALVGGTAAGQYPLAKTFALEAAGGRVALVNAAGAILGPCDVIIPLGITFLAARTSVTTALAALSLQPLGLLILAIAAAPRPPPPAHPPAPR